LSGTFRVLEAAKFTVSDLCINPAEVRAGDEVTVTADITNTGECEGTFHAELMLDGNRVDSHHVIVAPGATHEVNFTLLIEEPGTYGIELGSLSGTLSVVYGPSYSNPQTYLVTRTLTIRNETAHIDRIKVWMPMVVEWDSQRNIVIEGTTPFPSNMWKDPQYGSGVLFWEFRGEPGRGSSLSITDQFVYTCYEVNYYIDMEKIGTYDKRDPDYVLFTRSENYLQANDSEIVETCKQIVGDEANPYTAVHSIYQWVIDHMTYQLVGGLKGAKFAFENGYGECGDYSALFVALCRAAGIPARPVVGRWATSEAVDWHVWAEFYLPGYSWIPVDPTVADTTGQLEDNFGHLDNKRLIFNKTYNIVLHPEPYFLASEAGLLQTLYWEYHGLSGVIQMDVDYSIRPIASDLEA
jgi:transglutaminase-like putative cysteine protease